MLALHPILLAVFFASIGQIVMKESMLRVGKLTFSLEGLWPLLWRIFYNPWTIAGVACYGVSMFFWLIALSKADLSYVYPFTSLLFVIILFASWFIFHEPITWPRLIGVALICSGIFFIFRS